MKKLLPVLSIAAIAYLACLAPKQKSPDAAASNPLSICAPKSGTEGLNTEPGRSGAIVPLFKGLTDHFTYPVSTENKLAQKYFDQGLMLAYGFNHAEAARSFREVIRLDPQCAMGYWGIAYVLGPNYNATMDTTALPQALDAIQQARLLLHKTTAKEQALIDALSKRYPKSRHDNFQAGYEAYAGALQMYQIQYPDDPDFAAMTAEALMDMHPWDLWEKDGSPKSWTPPILSLIERTLSRHPEHVQSIHLYIHATEASDKPERALPYLSVLARKVPGSGHLVHMPSHTQINTGHYHEGVVANERAIRIDSLYVEACHADGLYPLAYYPHNRHFLAACAALEGQGKKSVAASKVMKDYVAGIPFLKEPTMGFLQHYYSIPWFIMVKFAMWDEILREPRPDADLKYPTAILEYARGMALSHKGDLAGAKTSLAVVKTLETDSAVAVLTMADINKIPDIIRIARCMLEAEIARAEGRRSESIQLLSEAVAFEDQLNFNEPPDWFFSIRHYLGQALIEAGRYEEAEAVYRRDLLEHKSNGWALKGLQVSLEKQGKTAEAGAVERQYRKSWQYADRALESSVLQ